MALSVRYLEVLGIPPPRMTREINTECWENGERCLVEKMNIGALYNIEYPYLHIHQIRAKSSPGIYPHWKFEVEYEKGKYYRKTFKKDRNKHWKIHNKIITTPKNPDTLPQFFTRSISV